LSDPVSCRRPCQNQKGTSFQGHVHHEEFVRNPGVPPFDGVQNACDVSHLSLPPARNPEEAIVPQPRGEFKPPKADWECWPLAAQTPQDQWDRQCDELSQDSTVTKRSLPSQNNSQSTWAGAHKLRPIHGLQNSRTNQPVLCPKLRTRKCPTMSVARPAWDPFSRWHRLPSGRFPQRRARSPASRFCRSPHA